MKKEIDIKDKKFGLLTAVDYISKGMWKCKCDCGYSVKVRSTSLRSGATKSCGCLTKERITYNGETKFISEFEKQFGFGRCVIYKRIELGWSVKDAIETPTRRHKNSKNNKINHNEKILTT